jgi:type II secretion system protein H
MQVAGGPCRLKGFTLIEIMVVIAIIGLILTTAIPFVSSSLTKDPMRQAVSDVVEACSQARTAAILSGIPAELVLRPGDRSLSVSAQSAPPTPAGDDSPGPPVATSAVSRQPFSAVLSEELVIEMLDVNLREFKDEELARVRFFPNGTCDEFTLILQWESRQWRKISLEILTSLANVESLR